ncbi:MULTISPECIES: VIT domain-containing protein [Okeania]|uniref:VWA domain-containing protein n=2 Tax=Okeania TaxID=1458928 RepID=A0A3N6RLM2_9CYAN|nr:MULTISPECIES: VIT domain-containing protein [Okeania]NES90242.1 after-VIT domain-containing protein [Okeania sp. SIO2B9]NET19212.1 after-VIT domain-containing protein [Okeania sp. SIO1H5]NET93516.1 after-VIT domain-containing protein [Okeania sp. SIO1H2]RQH48269.1 VWA domain-containing protein [Okeania hirsuta]
MSTNTPTLAGLYVVSSEEKLTFPLKHTEVKAKIAGNLSRIEVTQKFENSFTEPLEATYVFPLPDEAAVDEMEIKIGDRLIKGNIKKREEAKKIYQQAKQQGRTAGLLEQQRDNIFTQSLANIKPGEQIDVIIRYTDSLKFEGGDYEFVFPMVVGPRYIPGTPIDRSGDTDQVPDASQITPPIVPPATRSGHDIGMTVEINCGMPIFQVNSISHQIQTSERREIVTVKLGNEDTIPNKDFILRYKVASDRTKATVLTQADERGGYFAVYLIPALRYRSDEIVPKDVVFLMDTSGSQRGEPLLKCQELMRRFIHGLNPNDTFTIIDFANTARKLSEQPLPNTPNNIATAINYINRLTANGGTELLNGIEEVLNFPPPPAGRLRSIVMLTDGYIGNEKAVLAEVQDQLQPGNRLYSFGVGSSVNRYLINRLAEIGRGIARVVRQDEPSQEVAEKFFQQINNPVLTQIEVEWNGRGEVPEIYPVTTPDLFAEQPLVLFGQKQDAVGGELQVNGIAAGGEIYQQTFDIHFADSDNIAVAQIWARQKIKHLMNQMFDYDKKSVVKEVTETALSYQLLSEYTAFVAVSEEVRVEPGGKSISMEVPVEMPEGVSYEGFGAAPERFRVDNYPDRIMSTYSDSPDLLCRMLDNDSDRIMSTYSDSPDLMMQLSQLQAIDSVEQQEKIGSSGIKKGISRFLKQGELQETASTKEVRMRYNISDNDYPVRLSHIERVLKTNDKVLVKILVRDRKIPTSEQLLKRIATDLKEVANVEETPKVVGNFMRMVLSLKQKDSANSTDTPLQIIQVIGLDAAGQENLQQHLQNLNIPPNIHGEIVLELQVKGDRVLRVILDDEVSSLKDKKIIEEIKRSLLKWCVPSSAADRIQITIKISS